MKRKVTITGLGKPIIGEVEIPNKSHLEVQKRGSRIHKTKNPRKGSPRKNTKHKTNLTAKYR